MQDEVKVPAALLNLTANIIQAAVFGIESRLGADAIAVKDYTDLLRETADELRELGHAKD